jgi:hypothetical protein
MTTIGLVSLALTRLPVEMSRSPAWPSMGEAIEV